VFTTGVDYPPHVNRISTSIFWKQLSLLRLTVLTVASVGVNGAARGGIFIRELIY
jgi:hypothetical protein